MDDTSQPQDVVVQLLRILSEVDLDGLGEDLRRVDGATARRAMTGASMLAEALTRATFGSNTVADAFGVDFGDPPFHEPQRSPGVRITVHDDEDTTALDTPSEA
ncbi:hypothetical protein [Janibacter cremeus]|uniref:Uncharacterized protein n=1 Tax=Janibacter cremeus TaxID=1285192 RepID=A0A852VR56_9MICO|nr:hypothetical protein [Janibacter cremeus]NYF96814.1 hypothetical protein [Janibacter cremeus]